jgi:hypothetical protein
VVVIAGSVSVQGSGQVLARGGAGGQGGDGGFGAAETAVCFMNGSNTGRVASQGGGGGGGGGGEGGQGGTVVFVMNNGSPSTSVINVAGGPGGTAGTRDGSCGCWGLCVCLCACVCVCVCVCVCDQFVVHSQHSDVRHALPTLVNCFHFVYFVFLILLELTCCRPRAGRSGTVYPMGSDAGAGGCVATGCNYWHAASGGNGAGGGSGVNGNVLTLTTIPGLN